MEFWGVEVKAGEARKVQPQFAQLIHISHAAIGEVKDFKGVKNVNLRLKIDGKNFVFGSLNPEDRTQVMFDLVFHKEFELSHDLKKGSVFFLGYTTDNTAQDEEFDSEDDSDEELVPAHENGDAELKTEDVKASKASVTNKVEQSESDEEDDDSDDDDKADVDSDSDDDMALDAEGDSSDDSGDDDSEEDSPIEKELPKSKKRSAETAKESQVPSKKAKSDNKGVKPQSGKKSKEHSPKSGDKANNNKSKGKGKRGGK